MNKTLESLLINSAKKKFELPMLCKTDNTKIISFVNPFSYLKLTNEDVDISEIDDFYIDGKLLVYLMRLKYKSFFERISFDFSSIADAVFSTAIKHNMKIAIIGSRTDILEKSVDYFNSRYPDLRINYFRNGYINEDEYPSVLSKLQDSDIILLGLGTPFQEAFALEIKEALPKGKYIYTCGGFIEQTGIKGDFYKPYVKKSGLLWLQRAYESPHVRRRLIIDYPKFTLLFLLGMFRK